MVKYHSTRQRHIENLVHSAVFIETDRPYRSSTCPVLTCLRRWLRAPSPHHDCDLKDAAHCDMPPSAICDMSDVVAIARLRTLAESSSRERLCTRNNFLAVHVLPESRGLGYLRRHSTRFISEANPTCNDSQADNSAYVAQIMRSGACNENSAGFPRLLQKVSNHLKCHGFGIWRRSWR